MRSRQRPVKIPQGERETHKKKKKEKERKCREMRQSLGTIESRQDASLTHPSHRCNQQTIHNMLLVTNDPPLNFFVI